MSFRVKERSKNLKILLLYKGNVLEESLKIASGTPGLRETQFEYH
jgi:hypothetical protein